MQSLGEHENPFSYKHQSESDSCTDCDSDEDEGEGGKCRLQPCPLHDELGNAFLQVQALVQQGFIFTKMLTEYVFLATYQNQEVTVKIEPHSAGKSVPMEIRLLAKLRGVPRMQQLVGYQLTDTTRTIVSRYWPQPYPAYLERLHGNAEVTRSYMYELLNAIKALHDRDIIHRDIKLDNVLWDGRRVHLIDFGCATVGTGRTHDRVVGTPGYEAPEIRVNDNQAGALPYGAKIDIFSAGVLFGLILFKWSEDRLSDTDSGRQIREWRKRLRKQKQKFRDPQWDLLRAMLQPVADQRPSARECLAMPYFAPQHAAEREQIAQSPDAAEREQMAQSPDAAEREQIAQSPVSAPAATPETAQTPPTAGLTLDNVVLSAAADSDVPWGDQIPSSPENKE
jgi:serine/threonine protein kinase